jgi:uncharacterized damage-inducible protein DinB
MDVDNFRRLFRYDHWANEEVLNSLKAAKDAPSRSLGLLAHVLGAEYVWYSRLRRAPSPLAIWPQLTVAECEHHVLALRDVWEGYLNTLGPSGLTEVVSYTNTKGDVFNTGISDILMHIVMHSAYHRGQIASDMRANGNTPASTDFIHAVRQHKLD